MRSQFDAVIVGAGVAGTTAAILLARAGWSVALVEKLAFPRRKVCGECIAASNLPLLAALGIDAALDAGAGPELRQVALWHGAQQVLADLPPAAHPKYRWGRALGRETLDTLLLEQARLAGATLLQPASVQAVAGAPGAWRCEVRMIESGATLELTSTVAIDAHGSWETLRADRPQQRRPRRASDLLAFKANFSGGSLPAGRLPVLCLDGGYGGMVVADRCITTIACCVRNDRLEALRRASPGLAAGDAVQAWLQQQCAGVASALQGAERDGPWLAVGPIAPGVRLADDGPLRIGNAAGEAHPILGEGMSMALQGAALLAARLVAAGRNPGRAAQAALAHGHAAQWRRQFAPRLHIAAGFAHAAMRPASARLLLALARRQPGLLTLGARWGGKVRSAVDSASIVWPAPPIAREDTP
jgi:2-polyprenyl-6-methoxyphenol hydroxylase-like FAD-dependent oxidoreductase